MHSKLIHELTLIAPLSEACKDELMATTKAQRYQKGHLLHIAGEVCRRMYFIEEGLVRFFYNDADGKEMTYQFYEEGSFTSIANSYYTQTPSQYSIELLEDSIIHTTHFSEFEALVKTYPELNEIYNFVIRRFLFQAEERINSLQFNSAEERYKALLLNHPSIIQRAPLGHVASYLGINQATLSRVRSKVRV